MTHAELGKVPGALTNVLHATNDVRSDLAESVSQHDAETAEQLHEISWRTAMWTIEILTGDRWNPVTEVYEPSPDFAGCVTGQLITRGPIAEIGEPKPLPHVNKKGRGDVSRVAGVSARSGATP